MSQRKESAEVCEVRHLGEIYRTAKSGAETVLSLLPYVKDERMKSLMTRQIDGYEKCAACAAEELEILGEKAKASNAIARFSSRLGATFGTMINSTRSHVAEMMLQALNAGITGMTRILNAGGEEGAARRLARDLVAFEEYHRTHLLRYL